MAASFPTLFSTASGVIGLVAGPSSAFQPLNYRVRLFSSLGLMVAPPACEPGADTFETLAPRLHHLAPGRPRLLAARWPGATGLASYLSGCLSPLFGGAPFLWHRRRSEVFTDPAQTSWASRRERCDSNDLSTAIPGHSLRSAPSPSARADTQ
jgi:hypothetical protein